MSQKTRLKCGKNSNDKTKDKVIIFLIGVIFLLVVALITSKMKPENTCQPIECDFLKEENISDVARLRYWPVTLDEWHDEESMRTMHRIFERLRFKFVNASLGDDWDILWSTDHPEDASSSDDAKILFAGVNEIELRRDQKINHFNGIGLLCNKVFMSKLNQDLPYILPIFSMPEHRERLNEFLENNPNVTIVEKNYYNRGVKIVSREDIIEEDSEVFYQQFMDNHFLIDGHAFDFGVFVLITSFDPLRIYRYEADVLFRFCTKKYHPFDPKDRSKYVVEDGARIAIEMPLFKENYKRYEFPLIKLFEKHVEERGFDVKELWTKIDDAIVKIVRKAEKSVILALKQLNQRGQNYFELVRFDIIFDNELNPYVMEVNMSPNLTPAEKRYEENVKLYEPLIYNTVQMIGGASHFEFNARFNESDITVVGQKQIAVGVESCVAYNCHRNCYNARCSICLPCASAEDKYQMREAVREHAYEGNFKRLFPSTLHYNDVELIEKMTDNNKVSIEWFKAQCESDEMWC